MAIDPFLWQQPFQDAYGSRRPPAPRRLSLDDLLAMQQQFQPTPRPQQARSVADLDQQDRRGVRQQSVIQGLAALGAAMQTNDWRYAGQGAADIAGMQQQAVEGANARAEEEWKAEQERRAREIEQEQRRGQQSALFGVYEKIAQAEPPGSRLTEKAEAAARAGSMAELQGLLGEVPRRQAARAKGYDPDLWDTTDRMQAELKAELERQQAAAAWEEEQKRLAKKEEIENQAWLERQRKAREEGLDQYAPPVYESPESAAARAGAVAEAQERARAKYRPAGAAGLQARWGQGPNGRWGMLIDDGTPGGRFVETQGQPDTYGELKTQYAGGRMWVSRKDDPTATWYEAPTVTKADPRWEQRPGGAAAPAPPPERPAPTPQERAEALGVRNNLTLSFERGADPAEAEALLRRRYPNGVGGIPIERIMAEAMAQAERRRKGGR